MRLSEVDAPSAPTRGVRASIALGYNSRANKSMFETPVGTVIEAGDNVFVLNGKHEWMILQDDGTGKRVGARLGLVLHKVWKTEQGISQGKK